MVRGVYVMEIDLNEAPALPHWPEDISLHAFLRPPSRGERAIHEAVEDAFRDLWGRPRNAFESFVRRETEKESFDPSLWLLARDGSKVCDVALCKVLDALGCGLDGRGIASEAGRDTAVSAAAGRSRRATVRGLERRMQWWEDSGCGIRGLRPVCFYSPYEATAWAPIGHRPGFDHAGRGNQAGWRGSSDRRSRFTVANTMPFPDPHAWPGWRAFRDASAARSSTCCAWAGRPLGQARRVLPALAAPRGGAQGAYEVALHRTFLG